jgi:hypothetical protein
MNAVVGTLPDNGGVLSILASRLPSIETCGNILFLSASTTALQWHATKQVNVPKLHHVAILQCPWQRGKSLERTEAREDGRGDGHLEAAIIEVWGTKREVIVVGNRMLVPVHIYRDPHL